ncbi:MAG: septum formation initiator family protein [Actinomycetota bacterium]|nr:septum formation initiator family protein [Actinomycetota bacterium]MDA8397443.1 septum formation initiator family protein [Actinomycetota bacterium]
MTDLYAESAPRRVRRGYLALGVGAIVLAVALILPSLFAYRSERSQLASTQAKLVSANKVHATLTAEIKQLKDLREVAYLAKKELDMVYPGSTGYVSQSKG